MFGVGIKQNLVTLAFWRNLLSRFDLSPEFCWICNFDFGSSCLTLDLGFGYCSGLRLGGFGCCRIKLFGCRCTLVGLPLRWTFLI